MENAPLLQISLFACGLKHFLRQLPRIQPIRYLAQPPVRIQATVRRAALQPTYIRSISPTGIRQTPAGPFAPCFQPHPFFPQGTAHMRSPSFVCLHLQYAPDIAVPDLDTDAVARRQRNRRNRNSQHSYHLP